MRADLIGNSRKSFYKAHGLLRAIKADPGAIASVVDFNMEILRLVIRAERHIIRHRKAIRQLTLTLKTARPTRTVSI